MMSGQDNFDAPSQLGFQGVAKFTATKSWFKTPRHRRDEPSKTKDMQHQCLLGVQHRQHASAPMWVVTFCSRSDVGVRVNDALSVSQILAHNFENVMVKYAPIFTGPQAQIPSSPYQQGLGLVRGYFMPSSSLEFLLWCSYAAELRFLVRFHGNVPYTTRFSQTLFD